MKKRIEAVTWHYDEPTFFSSSLSLAVSPKTDSLLIRNLAGKNREKKRQSRLMKFRTERRKR